MAIITTLILVQQYITRYVLSTALALGVFGNLTAIVVFSQKKHRINSCSIYLVAVSIFGLIAANWGIAPLVYALDHYDLVNSSLVMCRISGYIMQVCVMSFRSTLILMCADRYALCNPRASIRALCRPQIAYRSIGILLIFWMIVSIHIPIWKSIENNRCNIYGLYGQVISYYFLFFIGIIPISTLVTISILLIKTLRHLHSHVQPNDTRRMKRRDIQFMKLALAEVIVFVFCTASHPIMLLYTTISNSIILNKSAERKQIEAFASFITQSVLLYMNYNILFLVHASTSKTYRMEVKECILKIIGKLRGIKQNQGNATRISVGEQPRAIT
ncbi:unnamed protein product [Adineta steineri]|uniref:G-protein coupled receptors family 1 profile domain-containing protein n=1 Tax=Adineta steineri TaxID=433720 RepID=A0A814KBQ7_9BILA|nr:unnamed protein product [Adineta steineri]CAF1081149.1 unnamed protein product [Adineta steineri]